MLPLLDIAVYRSSRHHFVAALRHACHHDGFFQLRHRLPSTLTTRLVAEAHTFFARSMDEKREMDYSRSAAFRGYMANGVENTAGKPDLREQVEIAAEGPVADPLAWPPYERLRGPNQWPSAQPALREVIEEYTEHMLVLSHEITEALALALNLEPAALSGLFASGGPHWQLKLASYSPSSAATASGSNGSAQPAAGTAPAEIEPEIGVGAHTDSGFLTMLLQDDSGGLQAFTRGAWTNVPPLGDGVLVCNLGEVAELVSGGYLLATPHRVLSTPASRLSVPFFFNPALPTKVEPMLLPKSLRWERDAEYDEQQHWRRPSNAMIAEYGSNALKSLARSHPAVFAKHHPDLVVLDDGRVVRRGAARGDRLQ